MKKGFETVFFYVEHAGHDKEFRDGIISLWGCSSFAVRYVEVGMK